MSEYLLGLLQVLDFELVAVQVNFLLLELLLHLLLLDLQLMDLGVSFLDEIASELLLESCLVCDVPVHRSFFLFTSGLSLDGFDVVSDSGDYIIQLFDFLGVYSLVLVDLILVLIFVLCEPLLEHKLITISRPLGILVLVFNLLQVDSEFAEKFLYGLLIGLFQLLDLQLVVALKILLFAS